MHPVSIAFDTSASSGGPTAGADVGTDVMAETVLIGSPPGGHMILGGGPDFLRAGDRDAESFHLAFPEEFPKEVPSRLSELAAHQGEFDMSPEPIKLRADIESPADKAVSIDWPVVKEDPKAVGEPH